MTPAPTEEVIPLPPDQPVAEKTSGSLLLMDRTLVVLVLVLTVLLGSFAAINPDLWMTLATGRQIAQGEYSFGTDPFSWGLENVTWVNHSWLPSLIFYGIYSLLGGGALVAVKAFALAGLALFLLGLRGKSTSLGLAAFIVGMTMLASSMRIFVNPTTFSYVFLGATFYLLYRCGALGELPADRPASARAFWGVPLLFILWVNFDSWFVLGPMVVGLLWAGAALDRLFGAKMSLPGKAWAVLFSSSVAACFVSPYHVQVWQLPPELAYVVCNIADMLGIGLPETIVAGGRTLQQIQQLDPLVLMGPLDQAYALNPSLGWSWVGFSLFPVILLSVGSFVIMAVDTQKPGALGLPLGRLLVLALFLFLGIKLARLVPFLAVVAAAILLRNLDDWLTSRARESVPRFHPMWFTVRRSLRWGALALVLALLFLAWPGWLHFPFGTFDSRQRVAWKAEADPSLRNAALRLAEARDRQPAVRVFNLSPDLASYCAWFAPRTLCYLDFRYALFADRAKSFATTRLLLRKPGDPKEDQPKLDAFFDREKITHLAIGASNLQRDGSIQLLLSRLWTDPQHWMQEYGDGKTIVFARGGGADLFSQLNRQAFGVVPESERVGLPSRPKRREFLERYLEAPLPRSLSSIRSHLHLVQFVVGTNQTIEKQVHLGQALAAAQVCKYLHHGLASAGSMYLTMPFHTIHLVSLNPFQASRLMSRDVGPAAPLILAVREARRAVAESPYDFSSYNFLADAYKGLHYNQEDTWQSTQGQNFETFRSILRKVQMVSALTSYLELSPKDSDAHKALAEYYHQLHYLDLGLEHMQLAFKYAKEGFDSRNPNARLEFEQEKANQVKRLEAYEKEIKKRRSDFQLRGAVLNELDRIDLALHRRYEYLDATNKTQVDRNGMGLAKEALEILLNQTGKAATNKEAREILARQMDLLLNMGRVREVEKVMPDLMTGLGPDHWKYRALVAGALGDYPAFDEAMVKLEEILNVEDHGPALTRAVTYAAMTGQGVALQPMAAFGVLHDPTRKMLELANLYETLERGWCGFRTVRALMALEQGDTAKAGRFFLDALNTGAIFPDRPIAQRYVELLREQGLVK